MGNLIAAFGCVGVQSYSDESSTVKGPVLLSILNCPEGTWSVKLKNVRVPEPLRADRAPLLNVYPSNDTETKTLPAYFARE